MDHEEERKTASEKKKNCKRFEVYGKEKTYAILEHIC